jgi:hypothetical protein
LSSSAGEHLVDFTRRHGPCTGVAGIFAKGAIAAAVATEICYG